MQNYPVRANHRANLTPPSLQQLAVQSFGEARTEGDGVVVVYGALARLVAKAAGRELSIDVAMNPKVPEETARETIRRYNEFLESVTGYSSKERARRLRKSATETRAEA